MRLAIQAHFLDDVLLYGLGKLQFAGHHWKIEVPPDP